MKSIVRVAFLAGLGAVLLTPIGAQAQGAKCIKAGGWGTGVMQGFAEFMAEAAMKNSAKAKFGDTVKIGAVSRKCEWKNVAFECTATARACR
jgi:hypothetical protein